MITRSITTFVGSIAALLCIASSALAAPPPGWTATDLGTLGGTTSYAAAVNDAGKVVGDSFNADGFDHAFAWTPAGGMVDLGTLGPTATFSTAVAVNASGQVAGYGTIPGDAQQHAIRWSAANVAANLNTLGGTDGNAVAINDAGAVAGTSTLANGQQRAAMWPAGSAVPVNLGTLGGTYSIATAINANGTVVGWSSLAGDTVERAFSWSPPNGPMIDIGAAGNSKATAINAAGQIAGQIGPNPDAIQAFLRTGTTNTLIGTAAAFTNATAVNAGGQVVGGAPAATDATQQNAFSWTAAGGLVDIGTLGGSVGIAYAVNASGAVAGSSTILDDTANHAFYWTAAGGRLDLDTLGGNDSFAVAMNASGRVVGFSNTATGDTHAVAWQPGDSTPPVITPTVTGTLGQNGWYTSNVTVTWTVADPETVFTPTTCATNTVAADTAGTTFTCSSTSAGGASTVAVTIKRDATPPLLAFGAHPTSYPANQNVTVTCSASDATSGLVAPCESVNVAASTLPPGMYTRTTTATDNAGNKTTISMTFTVTAAGTTTSTPTTTTTTTPVVTKARNAAKVATKLSPKLRARGKSVLVTLHAPAGATASGTIQLLAKLSSGKKAKLKLVGSKAFKLAAGQTKTFTIALNKGGKGRLTRTGKLNIRAVIAARDAAGKAKKTTRTIALKLARK